eukprot:1859522-Rhodomonas_salina.1
MWVILCAREPAQRTSALSSFSAFLPALRERGAQNREEWDACRLRQFDAAYDFETYEFKGKCQEQVRSPPSHLARAIPSTVLAAGACVSR